MIGENEPAIQGIAREGNGRWQKGQSGNPAGPPKGKISLVAILRKRLEEHPEEAHAIVNSLIQLGKTRELGAIKELLDRIDGKVAETHKIEGELPIKLLFMPAVQLLANGPDILLEGGGNGQQTKGTSEVTDAEDA